jgi:HK97 family phage major capsid protein
VLPTATRKSDAPDTETGETKTVDPGLIKAVEEKYAPQLTELDESIKSLSDKIDERREDGGDASKEEVDDLTKKLSDLAETQKSLLAEREQERTNARIESLGETAKSLSEAIAAAREPHSDFSLGRSTQPESPDGPYDGTEFSFFKDAAKAMQNENGEEWKRWEEAVTEKAMTQASGSTGGYLVPPEVSSELLQIKEQSNILRPLFNSIQVNADVLRIAAQTSGLLAGWVAELAEKPESELSFGEISVNVFWKAGMAVVSNQLLRNSNPSIDRLIYSDLGRRLAALEEIAFISGTGVGQPLGILRTPGVQYSGDNESGGASAYNGSNQDDLLDAIVDAITAIYTEYFGGPNAIIMHPRTWAYLIKGKTNQGEYIIGNPSQVSAEGGRRTAALPGYGAGPNPTGQLFGFPVYTTRNMPTNAGANDDEGRIIVGNFQEGLVLDPRPDHARLLGARLLPHQPDHLPGRGRGRLHRRALPQGLLHHRWTGPGRQVRYA